MISLMNDVDMTEVILENKSTLDKYIGDAIVAFMVLQFLLILKKKKHETALQMQEKLEVLRKNGNQK